MSSSRWELQEAAGRVRLVLGDFTLELTLPKLTAAGCDYPLDWHPGETGGALASCRAQNRLGVWQWSLRECRNGAGVPGFRIEFSGELDTPLTDLTATVFALDALPCSRVVSQGISMGGCASIGFPAARTDIAGYYQLLIARGRQILQLTLPQRQQQPTAFHGVAAGDGLESLCAQTRLHWFGGSRVEAVPVEFYSGTDGFALMEQYAADMQETPKEFPAVPPAGWNSWDYYRWTITEAEVLKNAETIARDPVLSRHVKRIIVDDGWQYCYGEWDANPLFPGGMAKLARELTGMGFEPGLWFAPAIVEPHARIAQWDTDMLAAGDGGEPCLAFECMQRYGFILDPTVPKSRQFLTGLFDRYAGYGYRYFKLDFLGMALQATRFADAMVPKSDIVRRIVEPIHRGIAGRAAILGCNYHFEAGNRYVDAVRVASDIHARWDSLEHNTVSVATRFWSNRRWWLNDPDFAVARCEDTSDDPDLFRLQACLVGVTPDMDAAAARPHAAFRLVDQMRRPQVEILLSVVLCGAGAVNLSDDMAKLNAVGLDLVRRLVAAEPGETARPLDLFEHDVPERWLQRISSGWRVLLVNWSDAPKRMEFDFSGHGIAARTAADFWNDTPLAVTGNRLVCELAPRSCRFATVTENKKILKK